MVGHSISTPDKQVGLDFMLKNHIALTNHVLNKQRNNHRYYYIDAYAGDGRRNRGTISSPECFLNNRHLITHPFSAFFIDKNTENIRNVRTLDWKKNCSSDNYYFCPVDNAVILPEIAESIYEEGGRFGLLYCDSNGKANESMMRDFSRRLPTIDILIRFNAIAYKRSAAAFNMESDNMYNLMRGLNKSKWILRGPIPGCRWQFSFLFGTNYSGFKAWRSKGFFEISDLDGKQLFLKLNYTKQQLSKLIVSNPSYQKIVDKTGHCELCGIDDELTYQRGKYICSLCQEKKYEKRFVVESLFSESV